MVPHGGLTLAHEAIGTRRERCDAHPGRRTMMLVTVGLWVAATGIVALSLESVGAALVCFGVAALLIRLAS
jgi:hypothetical protein